MRTSGRSQGVWLTIPGPSGLCLEESPKWHLLRMVLEEVRGEVGGGEGCVGSGRVLVVVNDERTSYQLKQVATPSFLFSHLCVCMCGLCRSDCLTAVPVFWWAELTGAAVS